MNWKALRTQYKPQRVKVLFIGESPPAGDTYFFAGNSNLFRATRNAFEKFLSRRFNSPDAFLRFLCKQGFFLEDLCSEPVNRVSSRERRQLRREAIPSLSARLESCGPKAIVVVMKGIKKQVTVAVSAAALRNLPLFSLPFPAFSHTGKYEVELYAALRSLQKQGIIRGQR